MLAHREKALAPLARPTSMKPLHNAATAKPARPCCSAPCSRPGLRQRTVSAGRTRIWAYPFRRAFPIPHGLVPNGTVLPRGDRLQTPQPRHLYAELAPLLVKNLKAGNALVLTSQLVRGGKLSDLEPTLQNFPRELRDAGRPRGHAAANGHGPICCNSVCLSNITELTESQIAGEFYRKAKLIQRFY